MIHRRPGYSPHAIKAVQEGKSWLRRRLRHIRQGIGARRRAAFSERISAQLPQLPAYRRARCVAAFVGIGSEVGTDPILQRILQDEKTLLLPVTRGRRGHPAFVPWEPGMPLRKTRIGTWEPVGGAPVRRSAIDLFLIPGLGFDAAGYRLGSGGGYYDRALRAAPHAARIGVFFGAQQVHRLPRAPWDIPLDAALTDTGTFLFRPGRRAT